MVRMSTPLQKIDTLDAKDLASIDVVCMGHFNILHPGHFRFLNFAASKGEQLCVILKGDDELSETESQHFFPEDERASSLNCIGAIKYIVKKDGKSLKETLELIKPKTFVLGHEFQNKSDDASETTIEIVKTMGIEILFHSGDRNLSFPMYSTEKSVLFSKQDSINYAFLKICKRRDIELETLKRAIKQFSKLKTLVIGDLIVDEFITSEPLGLSSEAPVVVVKELEKQQYVGGAGVVAAHIASLGASCHFLSVAGNDVQREIALQQLEMFKVKSNIIIDENRPTTFKTRYIAHAQKVFRVSRLLDTDIDTKFENELVRHVERIAPHVNNIVVSDFVYGVVTQNVLNKIREIADKYNLDLYGDLQCSSQVGNVLKFRDFDLYFPTEKEARIAIENKNDGLEFVAQTLFDQSKCSKLVIKLGAEGLIAYERQDDGFIKSEHFPALSTNAVDVSGAGDSMLSAISSSLTVGLNMMEACALGSVMAACAVEMMGNIPIDSDTLVKRLETVWASH